MKKGNLAIIATIIATFVFATFAFQPTATEARNNATPNATPNPRKIRKLPKQSIEVENDETHRTQKTKRKVQTSTGDQPEMQRTNSRNRNKKAIKRNNKFFDAPKLDADSGLEVVGNRNTNQQRNTSKPKGKQNPTKRVHKP